MEGFAKLALREVTTRPEIDSAPTPACNAGVACNPELAAPKLYPLPFGQDKATAYDREMLFPENFNDALSGTTRFAPIDDNAPLRFALSVLNSSRLHMVALSSTALRFETKGSSCATLLFPLIGTTTARSNEDSFKCEAGRLALYLPPGSGHGECTERAVVAIGLQPDRMEELARLMSGARRVTQRGLLDLDAPKLLDMRVSGIRFDNVMRSHLAMVDAMGVDGEMVERSGVADMILRSVVMLLSPELFFADNYTPHQDTEAKVFAVCDYIDSRIGKKVALSELQEISGLSARSLQYAFQSIMGCTPMQWVIERRLEAVRNRMLSAGPGMTLSAIASEYFSNLGDFARHYRLRYGELPSETLAKASRSG